MFISHRFRRVARDAEDPGAGCVPRPERGNEKKRLKSSTTIIRQRALGHAVVKRAWMLWSAATSVKV